MPTPSDLIIRRSSERRSTHVCLNATCPQEHGDNGRLAHTQYAASLQAHDANRHSPTDTTGTRSHLGKILYDEQHDLTTDTAMAIDDQSTSSEEEASSFRSSSRSASTSISTSTSTSPSPGVADCSDTTVESYFAPTLSTSIAPESLEFSRRRLTPNYPSSYLRYGSKFVGTQQSDKQVYHVEVEIKNVDIANSSICGYLRIDDLTPDHPTLVTFFEGEIVGPKHSFVTRHSDWGCTEKIDMRYWERFPAFRALPRAVRRPDYKHTNTTQRENIFMRWKEKFLVPDHKAQVMNGASFDGFYYICFNQVRGDITGIYFHAESTKYQQLELKHVRDNFCLPGMEFR